MDAKSQIIDYNAKLDNLKQEKYKIQDSILDLARNKEYDELAELIVEYPDWVKTGELAIILGCKQGKALEYLMESEGWSISTKCVMCHSEFETPIRTKEQIKSIKKPGSLNGIRPICKDCDKKLVAKSKERAAEATENLIRLKTMPYREYLQTEHWQDKRAQALKSANHKCQICNSGTKILNVHHRTYERRGEEYIKDLVVLCQDCHGKFHDKLPEEI